jgi:hypothetical protein
MTKPAAQTTNSVKKQDTDLFMIKKEARAARRLKAQRPQRTAVDARRIG